MAYEREDQTKTLLIHKGGTPDSPRYVVGRVVKVKTSGGESFLETLPEEFLRSPDLWYFDAIEIMEGTSIDRKDERGTLGLTHIASGSIERSTA